MHLATTSGLGQYNLSIRVSEANTEIMGVSPPTLFQKQPLHPLQQTNKKPKAPVPLAVAYRHIDGLTLRR